MRKLLVLTDLHITPESETIIGLDPAARLRKVLEHAAAHHADADRLILTGDLTNSGTAIEYDRLARNLQTLPWPVTYLLGNHDRRAGFCQRFPEAAVDADGFVQTVVDLPEALLICLDTLDEGGEPKQSGFLCDTRLDWLKSALTGAADRDVIVFLHHPPFLTGFGGMDSIGLRNRSELLAMLNAHGRVRLIVAGHIHRTITGNAEGIPAVTFKSPCHQMPMVLFSPDHSLSVDEPGAYGILLIGKDGAIVAHTEDVF